MKLKSALLYTALTLGAIAPAGAADLSDLATGPLRALAVHEAPKELPDAVFVTADGNEVPLSDSLGKPVVLNFWATWCAPCRKEMPALDRLAAELGDTAEVITVQAARANWPAAQRLFDELEITQLPLLADGGLSRQIGILGLPVTVVLDAEGREVGRLTGDAEWDAPEAVALMKALAE